ncbi:MAG: alpha/beta hydrolase [Burkholderiaceae bacterium]
MPRTLAAPLAPPLAAPSLALLVTEPLRALFDYASSRVGAGAHKLGDGHPVIVYPGLGGGAFTTSQLRRYLAESGFAPHDWGQGVNTGPVGDLDTWLGTLEKQVDELYAAHGRKVSLVGWSLGGIYARELAKRMPGKVRQVITLGTPFGALGEANHASRVYRLLNGDTAQLTPQLQARLRRPPNVPTTSIYSRSDGVVCWQGCVEKDGPRSESIEITASHLGMVSHPGVLRTVAERLAQREGRWRAAAARAVRPASRSSRPAR